MTDDRELMARVREGEQSALELLFARWEGPLFAYFHRGHGLLNGVFIGSLIPHISYGIALGLLLERYVAYSGAVFALVRGAVADTGGRPVVASTRAGRR